MKIERNNKDSIVREVSEIILDYPLLITHWMDLELQTVALRLRLHTLFHLDNRGPPFSV
jgi:hypothetical protein